MKFLLAIAFISIALVASSGLKKTPLSWPEIRAQQQADSAAYEAVYIIDSIRRAKPIKK